MAETITLKPLSFVREQFKAEAERFRAYNALVEAAREALFDRMPEDRAAEDLEHATEALKQRAYIDEFIGGGKPGKRFADLIQSYVDEYEEALNSRVLVKDMRELTAAEIPDASIDAIVTDPPYPCEFVDLFDDLGALAARVLKPGGSLVVLCGQSYLPQYLDLLTLLWTIGVHMPGGQAVQLHQREVTAFWKPALWFTKGERDGKWVSDLGGGTTGVICRGLKRKLASGDSAIRLEAALPDGWQGFIGVEIDEKIEMLGRMRTAALVQAIR